MLDKSVKKSEYCVSHIRPLILIGDIPFQPPWLVSSESQKVVCVSVVVRLCGRHFAVDLIVWIIIVFYIIIPVYIMYFCKSSCKSFAISCISVFMKKLFILIISCLNRSFELFQQPIRRVASLFTAFQKTFRSQHITSVLTWFCTKLLE